MRTVERGGTPPPRGLAGIDLADVVRVEVEERADPPAVRALVHFRAGTSKYLHGDDARALVDAVRAERFVLTTPVPVGGSG